ncbi:transcription factor E4F1-like [Sycon ciliatum]|uniref:transcription factor E4F1-like n=1 Tax=Sycon ciliatum TaxID=27933 RepID=UPI0031F707AF
MSDWLLHAHAAATADQEVAAAAAAAAVAEVNQAAEALTVLPHGLMDGGHNAMQPPEAGAIIETATVEDHAVQEGALEQVITTSTDDPVANEALQQALNVAVAMVVCVSQEGASSVMCASDGAEAKPTTVGEPQFVCETCGQRFLRKSHLSRHRLIHSGERPFQCDMCDKSFRQSSHLSSHRNTHTGARPYVCGQCDKAFASSSALGRHRHTHTDPSTKPHVCECGKAFRRLSHLVGHRYTHTGERPYQCSECDRAFADSSGLRRHRRRHAQGTVGPDGARRAPILPVAPRTRSGTRRLRGTELEDGELLPFDENALTEMAREEAELEEGGTAVTLITDDLLSGSGDLLDEDETMDCSDREEEMLAQELANENMAAANVRRALGTDLKPIVTSALDSPHHVSSIPSMSDAAAVGGGVGVENGDCDSDDIIVSVDPQSLGVPHSTIRITEEALCPEQQGATTVTTTSSTSNTLDLDITGASLDASSLVLGSSAVSMDSMDGVAAELSAVSSSALSLAADGSGLSLATSTAAASLDVSMVDLVTDTIDDLVCTCCNEAFTKMSDLVKHAKVLHVGRDDKPFRCSQCLKCFARLGHLRRHQKSHMPSVRPFACEVCSKYFRLFSHLNAHRYACHLQAGKTYKCSICKKVFMDESSLCKHNDRHIVDAQEAAAAAAAAAAASADSKILTNGLTGEQAEALSAAVADSSGITMSTASAVLGHDGGSSLQPPSPVLARLMSGTSSEQEQAAVQLLSSIINTTAVSSSGVMTTASLRANVAASMPHLLPIVHQSAGGVSGGGDLTFVTPDPSVLVTPVAGVDGCHDDIDVSGMAAVTLPQSVGIELGTTDALAEIVHSDHLRTIGEERIIHVDHLGGMSTHQHLGHLSPDGAAEEVIITVTDT